MSMKPGQDMNAGESTYLGWPGAAPGPSRAPTSLYDAEAADSGIAQRVWPLRPVMKK